MTKEQKNKLGRYEKGNSFVTFSENEDGTVRYAWGTVAFGERSSEIIDTAVMDINLRVLSDYKKVVEAPVSEGNNKAAGELLDWISGITR